MDVTPALKAHAEEQFKKIEHIFEGKPAKAHVILEVERGGNLSSATINWRNETLTAETNMSDMYMSITQTIGKIEKQARRLKDKVIDKSHKATKASAVTATANGSDLVE